ncbi:MAG: GNAT family N-acetyltransferase [Microbacterium sp.]|jgi:predicted GNAT superfamily acetyltransferase|uniref:GNAT family N-acetyltransferase n=1 Tax=Microbacterium sp. TaxID=51671 RepID=UPI002816A34C|nr:GNAT family N-acetyltransferase [Microbacterium sp.]MDR2321611.1 GNAT family N-acetyltransferase [Microbacterium sp.]
MTGPSAPATAPRDDLAEEAALAATAAEARSGVRIRLLDDMRDLAAVRALYEGIWDTGAANPPVTADMLRALVQAGNYVAGAFDDTAAGPELVGACFGFFGPPAARTLHSHIAGTTPAARGRHLGFALKLHQRAWALRRDIDTITWTYDPLIRRNAHFNLGKLAASVGTYLPRLYGSLDDSINRGDETDRILVRWELRSPQVVAAAAHRPLLVDAAAAHAAGAAVAVRPDAADAPRLGALDAETVLVGVPADIEGMRDTDLERAAEWRLAVRDILSALLDDGATVRGFDRDGWYIIDRQERS